jgi:hypothetical protein
MRVTPRGSRRVAGNAGETPSLQGNSVQSLSRLSVTKRGPISSSEPGKTKGGYCAANAPSGVERSLMPGRKSVRFREGGWNVTGCTNMYVALRHLSRGKMRPRRFFSRAVARRFRPRSGPDINGLHLYERRRANERTKCLRFFSNSSRCSHGECTQGMNSV